MRRWSRMTEMGGVLAAFVLLPGGSLILLWALLRKWTQRMRATNQPGPDRHP